MIAGAILKIGGGLALFGLSLAALIAIANNPEIVAPGTWVASLFGVNLGQAVLKSLSGVTQGLSLFFHGLIDLGGTFNWAKGIRLAIDGVLTVIDPINVLLSALATATRFSSVGNIVGNVYRLVKEVVIPNGNALVSMVQTLLDTHKNLGL